MNIVHFSGNEKIDFAEFLTMMARRLSDDAADSEILEAFKVCGLGRDCTRGHRKHVTKIHHPADN